MTLGRFRLDTRGTFCPIPIVKISEAIRNVDVGVIIEMISDDPAIEYDLPAWCKSTGHEIVSLTKENGEFRIEVKKTARD